MKHTQNKISPMQTLRRAVRNRREHGMALLFTLCILSMALITAMIFSSNASTDRKVATAYIDTSAARILADGTVSRAILALMSSNASYACSNYLKEPPGNGSGKNADEYASDWIWKIEKPGMFSFNEGPLRYANKYYDREDTRCPSWEYVYYHAPDGTDRIYGRYAYVAIGQNDQLNPNALGNNRGKKLSSEDISIRDRRLGRLTCEPKFLFVDRNNLWGGSGGDPIITTEKVVDTCPVGGWTDMDIFFSDVTSADDKHLRMMVDQYFTLSGNEEYNKFNTRGDLIKDFTVAPASNEMYRFPLIRNDWNSITVDQIKSAIPYFRDSRSSEVNQTIANLINYNANFNRAPVTDVANWTTGEPSYTGNKCTPYINEVGGEVEVGGNLGIRMTERYLQNDNWFWRVWYTDCTYSHTITLQIETVNMYGSAAQPVSRPIPFGTITYEYLNPENGRWIPQEFSFDANNTKWDTTNTVSNGAYTTYTYIADSGSVGSVTTTKRDGYSRPMGHEADFYDQLKVRNVNVRLERVLLRDNSGQNADLSLMNNQLGAGNGSRVIDGEQVVAGSGDFSKRGYFDSQVDDPRCNLGRSEWSVPQSNEHWRDNFGVSNTTVSYKSNDVTKCDPGESGDPVNISTAFIPHEPMESLWELGAIHRGRPWQTINLKCAGEGKSAGSVMGDYSAGDGHLLDQVALVSQDEQTRTVLGMINLNCVADLGSGGAPFVFKSLFTDFPIYGSIQNMRNKSTTVPVLKGRAVNSTDSDADRYAQDLVDCVTYAVKNGNQPRRTGIFPGSASSGSSNGRLFPTSGNDAQREEVVCRIINLLKWGRQQTRRATVLVLAQTIQDVGGVTLERNLPNDNSVLMDSGFKPYDAYGESKWIQPALYPSAASIYNAYKKRSVKFKNYDNFYDRITGEAKVVVRLEWDDSANDHQGAWKVTRKEYAE
ncbi:MAG: hypothetical protein PUC15_10000 [Lentisphaeria bacterium]|nr:hypothetical protein [Lentisphaeria bacterium]